MDFTTREQVEHVYRRLARHYDRAARVLDVLGLGYDRLRREAVDALMLKEGDTVLEIGCGTGANFPMLEERIGPTGHIIGIDLTRSMLNEAEKRIEAAHWNNVELVHCAAKDYPFREKSVDAVVSTFALTLEPDYDAVIASVAAALRPYGRLSIADLKLARGWRLVFLPFLLLLVRAFAVSLKLANRHPWESMQRYLGGLRMTEYLGGYLYVASAIRLRDRKGARAALCVDAPSSCPSATRRAPPQCHGPRRHDASGFRKLATSLRPKCACSGEP